MRKREPVRREERIQPTPETVAKLQPDPVQVLFEKGLIDSEHTAAAAEIRSIYFAIIGGLFARANDYRRMGYGVTELSDKLAIAHRDRYKPWCEAMGAKLPHVMDAIADLGWCHEPWLIDALKDYASRMAPTRATIAIDRRAQMGY